MDRCASLFFFPLYLSELSSAQYFFISKGVFPSCHKQKGDQAQSAVNTDFISSISIEFITNTTIPAL